MFLAKKLNRGAGSPAAPVDAQFNYVTMLLHGDGTNGAQNNTFLDSSTNNFTITRNGNTTQGSFSPYGSNWSNYFDGTSNYLTAPNNSALSLGSETYWTVEFWAYFVTSPSDYDVIVGKGPSAYEWFIEGFSDNTIDFLYTTNGSPWAGQHQITPNMGTGSWFHVAAVRNNTTFKSYVNGTEYFSGASFDIYSASGGVLSIGGFSGGQSSNMYLSNLRIVKGTAVYTANFTPSTTPLTAITNTSLLTCQSNRFVDNSTNNFTLTVNGTPSVQRFNPFGASTAYSTSVIGGSGYFDGNDYLNTPSTSQFTASGDFTVSCWFYLQSFSNSYYVVGGNWDAGTSDEWLIQIQNNGAIRFLTSAGTSFSSSGVVKLNEWTYFTATRSGTTVTVQLNGTTVSTYTKSDTLGAASKTIYIGQQSGNNWPFNGYISDFRLLSGSAITAIPTAPVSSTSTGLLLSFTNAAIFDNAMMNDLETVGNAQISTSVVKYGTGSIKCTGDGNTTTTNSGYLLPNSLNSNLSAFGTGNFTIEFWLYLNSTSGLRILLDFRGSTETAFPVLYISGGTLSYYVESDRITGSSLSTSTWYHIALCRSSGSTKLFVNGTQSGSTFTDSINYANASTRTPVIGANSYTGGGNTLGWYALDGNIDDLRITKGYARYTANFTAPTAAFSDTGPY